jgi:ArsR family transcriptional regulator
MKALADETRLQIIDMLSCGESSCACKLLEHFAFTQPTLSYHMRILTESGLVKGVRDGAWMRYTLVGEKVSELKQFLSDLTGAKNTMLFEAPQNKKTS